jgi:primary-amine oxidase
MRHLLQHIIIFSIFSLSVMAARPLAPLSKSELTRAVLILKENGLLGDGWYLQLLALDEPKKEEILAGKTIARKVTAVIINAEHKKNFEIIIDLATKKIKQTLIQRGQPALMSIEYDWALQMVRKDERVLAALKKRGLDDIDKVYIDTWGVGDLSTLKVDPKHRLARTIFFYRDQAINSYGRPISGLSTVVDLTSKRVLDVIDLGSVAIPESAEDFFDEAWIKNISGGLINNDQFAPHQNKLSFAVDGNEIEWKGFRLQAFLHPREGLVISQVNIKDQGQIRPILYRGSLSEMVVPYGDPNEEWAWRCAFDEGDYGLGTFTNSLKLGYQVPPNAHTLDADYVDNAGEIKTIKNAIAIYERPPTMLWSHYDEDTGKIAAQMGTELVIMSMFTISNYDYAIQWVFNQSGEIKVNVLLTGIVAVKAVDSTHCSRCEAMLKNAPSDKFGSLVAKNVLGVIHQHFFNFRLDFSIDGINNSVVEINYQPVADKKENPLGNVFSFSEDIFLTEKQAARNINPNTGRHWWIINKNQRHHLGHFSGYLLEPQSNTLPHQQMNSQALKRAPFLMNQLWVTKYHPKEFHAAGTYPNQDQGQGLPAWTTRNAPLDNEDIVVWYTVGVDHVPRLEDWPVMPTHQAGFSLRPKGFFARNPSLNVVTP